MPIRSRFDDGVARLALDRPPLNVLDGALMRELEDAVGTAARTPDLRLIVLRGEGRAFSAGVDVGEHLGDAIRPMLAAFESLALRVLAIDVPTLAVVHGAALGGALELALCCDLVLASDDAKLGVPEITLGCVPPVAAALLPRAIGAQRAARMVLTGETVLGADAAAIGLVAKSVPAERLDAELERFVEVFRSRSASALRLAKRTLHAARDLPLADAIREADALSTREVPGLADAQEGLRAFLEKREPRWTHR